jgi:hypothetical protein
MGLTWDKIPYTWDERLFVWDLVATGGGGDLPELIHRYDDEKKNKLIKLILKVHGNTITESKQKEIKQYKITAKDIKLVVKEVLGAEMIAEGVSF